jgi:hypothetical protein
MKKIYLLVLTLSCFLSYGQVSNGGFETWSQTTNPDDWSFEAGTTLTQNTTTFDEGSSSMQVEVTTATQGNTDIRQTVTVVAGTVYDINVRVYQTDGGSRARLFIDGYQDYSDPAILNTWQDISYQYTATANGTIDIGFRFYDIAGVFMTSSTMYLDNFTMTPQATPSLAITSPSNNDIILLQDVDIAFSVQNFNVANPNTGDGYITYNVDGGTNIDKFDTSNIALTGLAFGEHTVNLELVDNSGASLLPNVVSSITFTISQVQTLPFVESFNYTDGETLGNQPAWTNNFSGDEILISTDNQSYSTLSGFGNSISFDGAGIDPAIDYTPTSSGKIYSSLMINVTSFSATATDGYFAILRNNSGAYIARLYISPIDATTYNIGVSSGNLDGATQKDNTVLSIGTTAFIVFNYNLDSDTIELWVNPTLGTSEPTANISTSSTFSGNTLTQFLLRQDSTTETPVMIVDELRIGTNWTDVAPTTLGTTTINLKNVFSIYPNPVSNGVVKISSQSTGTMTATIFDVLGKQVLSANIINATLNVSKLKAGVYILSVNQNGMSSTKKLVIN